MSDVSLKNINKIYDNKVQAVYDFNLEIKNEEFIVLVGPSGCGKSTTLRMIAGLEEITSGELYIDGELMNDMPPKDRNIAMVFQSYALYPHMNVYDNMAFGLRNMKLPKDEIDKRVRNTAKMLEIEQYLDRKPKELSGGQKQRVALGRAIVRNAKVFLMDEPLSNLDAKLRVAMRAEIIRLHKTMKNTTVYVTHDQIEAMTMADRIVVMKDGVIQQIAAPKDIYNKPSNIFVATFIGSPAMNLIKGKIKDKSFCTGSFSCQLPEMYYDAIRDYEGKDVILGIRPEHLHREGIVSETFPQAVFDMNADVYELLGNEFIISGSFQNQAMVADIPTSEEINGQKVLQLCMDLSKIHLFDVETEKNLLK